MRASIILCLSPLIASCYPDRVSSKAYNDLKEEVEALQEQVDALQEQLDANEAQDAAQDSAIQDQDGRLDDLEAWREGNPDTGGENGESCMTDTDGDGFVSKALCGGTDCDDDDIDVNPNAVEVCDGMDNNCDGDDATMVAAYFDASTDAVSITFSGATNYGDATYGTWTVEAWLYPELGDGAVFTVYKGSSGYEDYYFFLNGGLPSVKFSTDSTETSYSTASAEDTLEKGTWSHVAWVMDSGEIRIYINGTLSSSTAADTLAETSSGTGSSVPKVAIGAISTASIQPMYGYVSDVRISSDAMYTVDFAPSSRLLSMDATVSLWSLDDGGSSTTASDTGGYEKDGVLSGASWGSPPCRP